MRHVGECPVFLLPSPPSASPGGSIVQRAEARKHTLTSDSAVARTNGRQYEHAQSIAAARPRR